MNKHLKPTLLACCLILTFFLGGCGNKALVEATNAVEEYNVKASAYNERVASYNEAVELYNKINVDLQEAIDNAQEILNKDEMPYDLETKAVLENAIATTVKAKAGDLSYIDSIELLSLDEEMDTAGLKELTEKVIADAAEVETLSIPENPIPTDYTVVLSELEQTLVSYEDSVQSMKQVTAPSDEFIIARLRMVQTIVDVEAVTAEHDPNGMLNTPGGYKGCIYFSDSQVSKEKLPFGVDISKVIDIGTAGGGCIEVYGNLEDAENRNALLASYDGTVYHTGSHCIIGTCVVRTSKELTSAQQENLTKAIMEMLLKVE